LTPEIVRNARQARQMKMAAAAAGAAASSEETGAGPSVKTFRDQLRARRKVTSVLINFIVFFKFLADDEAL
jgi:hypothetical protein